MYQSLYIMLIYIAVHILITNHSIMCVEWARALKFLKKNKKKNHLNAFEVAVIGRSKYLSIFISSNHVFLLGSNKLNHMHVAHLHTYRLVNITSITKWIGLHWPWIYVYTCTCIYTYKI